MASAECPHCERRVNLSGESRLGQKVTCQHCGEKLEVIELNPVELDYEFGEEEYEYEYDDYDEYDGGYEDD